MMLIWFSSTCIGQGGHASSLYVNATMSMRHAKLDQSSTLILRHNLASHKKCDSRCPIAQLGLSVRLGSEVTLDDERR